MNHMELLAPAGSLEALEAAVESGADAVYIGGNRFNARAYADNLDDEMLRKAVEYAHIRGVKVYITVNIMILQRELLEVMKYISYLYSINVDAVIVQDIGLAMLIRKLLPDFEVHCSTQMAIHNADGASLLKEMGIKRVVLARELTLQEIDSIAESTGIEAEIFVHGALCVCYSGQCYMSSLIGGRSGNRGKCAQPCRKKYRLIDAKGGRELETEGGAFLISTRDLNTHHNLHEIAASKAASLKIEGRMKRPEYVAVLVHHYKEALDCIQKGNQNCISELAEYELKIAFNREFTEGYLFNKRNQEIVNIERPDNQGIYIGRVTGQKGNMAELLIENNFLNDGDGIEIIDENGKSIGTLISGIKKSGNTVKTAGVSDKINIYVTDRVKPGSVVHKTLDSSLFQKAREEYAYRNRRKISVTGIFTAKVNEVPTLTLKDSSEYQVTAAAAELVQAAEKLALTEDKVFEQLNKTKDTPYYFEKLELNLGSNCFLSVKTINNLRREALEKLSVKRIEIENRKKELNDIDTELAAYIASNRWDINKPRELIAGIRDLASGVSAINGGADTLYIIGDYRYNSDLQLIKELTESCSKSGCALFYVLPQITRNEEAAAIEQMLKKALQENPKLGLVISNLSHLKIAERLKAASLRSNFSMNVSNAAAAYFLQNKGVHCISASIELNLAQIKELKASIGEMEMETFVYGYLPVMVSEHCPASAASHCVDCREGCSREFGMVDDRNKQFRIINMGSGKNTILNSDVLCVYDHLSNIIESGVNKFRMDFYTENQEEVLDIVKAFKTKLEDPMDCRETKAIDEIKKHGYTKGHYFRGIE